MLGYKEYYSWEEVESKMPGKVVNRGGSLWFYGNPKSSFLENYHTKNKDVWLVQEFNMKFPKSVKNLRFRFNGKGQVAGGTLEW